MSEPSLIEREAKVLNDLAQGASERAAGEAKLTGELAARGVAIESEYRSARRALEQKIAQQLQKVKADSDAEIAGNKAKAKAEQQKTQQEYDAATKAYKQKFASETARAKKSAEDTRWNTSAVYDSGKESVKKHHEATQRNLAKDNETRVTLEAEANELLKRYGKYIKPGATAEAAPPPAPEVAETKPETTEEGAEEVEAPPTVITQFQDSIRAIDAHLVDFHKLGTLKILQLGSFAFIAVMLIAVPAVIGGFAAGWGVGAIGGGLAGLVLAILLWLGLSAVARKGVTRVAVPLRAELERSTRLFDEAQAFVESDHQRRKGDVENRRDSEIRRAEEELAKRTAAAEERLGAERKRVEEMYPPVLAELARNAEAALKAAEEKGAKRLADTKAAAEAALKKLDEDHAVKAKAHAEAVAQHWETLLKRWTEGSAGVMQEVDAIRAENDRLYPEWRDGWGGWNPPVQDPPGIRFGDFEVRPGKLENGTPEDDRLKAVGPADFELPALTDFRKKGSLLIRAGEEGRDEAVNVLQAAMLRIFTAIPAGRVRFTILDPAGMGRNFASFMHLVEYDEVLINQRVWTDTSQIDERLKDLTEHMENVILTYLRNDYETIEEYNAQAGEVAEPYRFLVIANFPHGFSETGLKLLTNIVQSGPRCGVHTLISIDTRAQMPFGYNAKDLEASANLLVWREGKFVWRDPVFEPFKLVPDRPPAPEALTEILHEIGKKSKEARRVEVPFDVIAPTVDKYWTTDSRTGIDVPLGRAGATKLQNLKLGKGTSQHVLIAGKTGSGKSTLLHALITNVALRYSPKEVELYLIDFKKGVEFKTYAVHELPHAKVIAVESEREFGLSVLERLDVELKRRGELYRAVSAQDVASYRAARPDEDLPRILLLVDEFQEFFVEDDKLAQNASLLLDRLVRQGRAFGIHVHLGSQSLGGAYGLARTTLAQMAIRVALQCSESDSHLILSEDNSAARLLSRPGEAIYNDSNGMTEGNHVFQIVWLGDAKREQYLKHLAKLADERQLRPAEKQIVFEGNTPAILSTNPGLNRLLDAPDWGDPPRTIPAWLGDAIAIKDPTEAPIQPQSGSNLLMVGQQPEPAAGVLTAAILGLAAHHEPRTARGARFVLFDGTPSDSPFYGLLPRLKDVVPHQFDVASVRAVPKIIDEIAEVVERRRVEEPADMPAIYLIIFDLTRFRDLRKDENDFGSFSGGDKKAPPSKQFVTILREGPMVNVHVLTWCDTVANLNRTFDRQGLGEFEMRVLFQMSAADSSQLIDSPAAGRLGENRAYFYSEEQGRLEKFRPYSPPEPEVLEEFRRRFDAKPKPTHMIDGDGLPPKADAPEPPAGDDGGLSDFDSPPRPAPAPPPIESPLSSADFAKPAGGNGASASSHEDLPSEDEWLEQFKRQIDEQRRQEAQTKGGDGSAS